MPFLTAPPATLSAAIRQARACLSANRASLARTQPDLVPSLPPLPDQLEFVFGRDGSLTARHEGKWLSGCSLPCRTAEHLLRSLELRGAVGCFLNPTHAAQLRVAFDHLSQEQAIIAFIPDETALHQLLHCADLSRQIAAHRLWFVTGENWSSQLGELLHRHPGLPTPNQFIRTALSDSEQMQQWITAAQSVFSAETQRRATTISDLCRQWRPDPSAQSWCVLAGTRFRLWHGAPRALWEQLQAGNGDLLRHDPDDPITASPIGLAQNAIKCRGVVMADLTRGDFPPLLPMEMPWVTWITTPRVPPFAQAGPNDRLLLADAAWISLALQAGWSQDRVALAHWPQQFVQHAQNSSISAKSEISSATINTHLALLINTGPIDEEPDMELSSHRLLWQAIAKEIASDPFIIGDDTAAYLRRRRCQMNISEEGFDTAHFISQLILPAYHQSIARLLMQNSLPLRLSGAGWDQIAEFRSIWDGPLNTHDEFANAVRTATALVHPEPASSSPHEIDALGLPVLRAGGHSRGSFIQAARQLLKHPPALPDSPAHSVLCLALLC